MTEILDSERLLIRAIRRKEKEEKGEKKAYHVEDIVGVGETGQGRKRKRFTAFQASATFYPMT